MKILIYTHAGAPLGGGVQIITRDLAAGLSGWSRAHGGEAIETTLVTQTPAGKMNDSEVPFRVVRQPIIRQLLSLIREADVVHIANPALVPLALGWLLRKRVVVEHSGYQAACPNGLLLFGPDGNVCPGYYLAGSYAKCVECNATEIGWWKSVRSLVLTFPRRWLAKRVDVNIAPTQHIGVRLALPSTRVISHGVPRYSSSDNGAASPDGAEEPYFAFVGRLVSEKGLPVLLRACTILAEQGLPFHLKIVGDGPERGHLEALTAELGLGLQIEFPGAIPVEQVPRLLRGAIAVIIPSIWEEVAPLVAYEQLMHGRLAIVSDIGGLGEIVDGVGLKFPPGNARALAGCMRRAAEEPEFAADVRKRAQQRAQEAFTLERMVENHLGVYKELAGAGNRQG